MATEPTIGPGARVHTRDGFLGTVERVEQDNDGLADKGDHLIVRAKDGGAHYRIPRSLVQKVRRRNGHHIVHLDLTDDSVQRYAVALREADDADEAAGPSVTPEAEAWNPQVADETLRIPVAAEELTAHTQPFTAGTVHLHKGVKTLEQRLTVPVKQEHVQVERIPADQFDPDAPRSPDEIIIPLMEERIVLQKQTVVREYLRIRKETLTDEKEIGAELRREYLDVTQQYRDGTTSGPSLHYGAGAAEQADQTPPTHP